MTKWEGAGEGCGSVDKRGVKVTRCDRDWSDQGIFVIGQFGGRDVAPLDTASLDEEQLLHLVLSLARSPPRNSEVHDYHDGNTAAVAQFQAGEPAGLALRPHRPLRFTCSTCAGHHMT
jgi:hypothetical protein